MDINIQSLESRINDDLAQLEENIIGLNELRKEANAVRDIYKKALTNYMQVSEEISKLIMQIKQFHIEYKSKLESELLEINRLKTELSSLEAKVMQSLDIKFSAFSEGISKDIYKLKNDCSMLSNSIPMVVNRLNTEINNINSTIDNICNRYNSNLKRLEDKIEKKIGDLEQEIQIMKNTTFLAKVKRFLTGSFS